MDYLTQRARFANESTLILKVKGHVQGHVSTVKPPGFPDSHFNPHCPPQ